MAILAYVDPGTGLLAWQAVMAAIVGTFFYVKKTRDWLFACFCWAFRWRKIENKDGPRSSPPAPDPGSAKKAVGMEESSANISR